MLPLFLAILTVADAAPPLSDLDRFPPLCVAEEQRAQALAYSASLPATYTLGEGWRSLRPDLANERAEAHARWDVWDDLVIAHQCRSVGNGDYARRVLDRIRCALGEADYAAALMPDPLPVWRFAHLP